jgi:16S rRNA (guanine(966)-N(2))-methyltransferase RsmD
MRVISGKYKGKRFFPPKKFPSRPTTDLSKEALFNIIDSKVYFEDLNVLDLFSGTGNISLEFLSRGVKKVVSVDESFVAYKFQNKIQKELNEDNWHILKQDAFKYIALLEQRFDLIFADPPYGLKGVDMLPIQIKDNNILEEDGMLIIEHGQETSFVDTPYFVEVRNYGGVFFSLFKL